MSELKARSADAIGAIYDAVERPQEWPRLIDAVARELALDSLDKESGRPALASTAQASELLPHLRRALSLIDSLNRADDSRRAMAAVLDRLPLGIFLVDSGARLEFANRCASEILDQGAPLTLVDHCLRTGRPDETRTLHRLIAEALRASEESSTARALVIREAAGESALSVLILSVQSLQYESQRPLAAVFAAAPEFWQSLNPETLHDLYGLTEAESRLVDRLCAGLSLQEAAEELEVSTNTVRTHLRAVFAKTNTSRQADLLREVITGVAYLSKPGALTEAGPPRMPAPAERAHLVTLADGRRLSCREYGDPAGVPVLFHNHATLGNRMPPLDAAATKRAGVRLLMVDRPGFGESDALEGRSIADWPADAVALIDELGLDRVAVLGYGIGGSFALQLAIAAPERVSVLSLVATAMPDSTVSVSPGVHAVHRFVGYLSHHFPALQRRIMAMLVRGGLADPASYFDNIRDKLCAPDRQALSELNLEPLLIMAGRHAVKQGADALCTDLQLHVADWPSPPSALTVPNQVWFGLQDQMMSPNHGRLLADALPPGLRELDPDAGHLILFTRWREIMAALVRAHRGD